MILEIGNRKYEFETRYLNLGFEDFLLFVQIQKMEKKNVLEKKLFFLKEKISSKHFLHLLEMQILAILDEIKLFEEDFKFHTLPKIFQTIKIGSIEYRYTENHFIKMRFDQFTKIERIIQYEEADIAKIMAVIYSNHLDYEAGFDGRVRFFQNNSFENEVRKLAITLYVNDCKQYIVDTYLKNMPKSSENTANGWFDNMVNVAKSGVFGDIHSVKKSYLHEVLSFMQKNYVPNSKI